MEFKWNMDTMGLIGKKQCGKTTIIRDIIKNVPKDSIIVLDTNLEYKGFNRIIPEGYNNETLERFILHCRKFKNKLIIFEDLDLYINSTNPPDELKNLFINGSHQNLGVIFTAKRPLGTPKILLTETTHLILGNFVIPNDINYLSGVVSDVNKIKNLKRFEFLCRNEDGSEEILKARR